MNKLSILLLAGFFLVACNNPGSNRNDQKTDVETSYPETGTDQRVNQTDTSANGVQDSSTTVGYDTSAVRKN